MNLKEIKSDPVFQFAFILTIAMAIGFQGWRTLLNNFAVGNVKVDGFWIGVIQSAREIPGFLSLLVIFITVILSEFRIASISILLMGSGIALVGLFPSVTGLIVTTLVMSTGFHYFETTRQSLVLQHFDKESSPTVLGHLNSIAALTNILVGIVIFLAASFVNMESMFFIIGLLAIVIAISTLKHKANSVTTHMQHKKMILKKKYWLYYTLNFLSGARRQIFVVFAVFLLVQHYGFSVELITLLFILNNLVNIFAAPYFAKKINRYGERVIFIIGYIILFFVFTAYAVFDNPIIAASLYIVDNIFFNTEIGIRTYFQKHADKSDIAPSMAVGFTINHICAVFFPFIGGLIWAYDYKLTFLTGAVIAVLSLAFSFAMKSKEKTQL